MLTSPIMPVSCTHHIALIMDLSVLNTHITHHACELYSSYCSHYGSLCPQYSHHIFSQAPYFTTTKNCSPYMVSVKSCKGDLFSYSNIPQSLHLTHPHHVLAVTAVLHHPPALTLSPRTASSPTVSTMSHNLSACSTASSHFLHISCK